jgi:hypothetical protein
VLDWGDGSEPAATGVTLSALGGGYWRFTATHVILDDNPTGTGADVATVTAFITDDDGGEAASSASFSVNDIGPVLDPLTLDATVIEEAETVQLSGTFFDPGLADTHSIVIDWSVVGNGRPRRPALFEGVTTITTQGPNPSGTTLVHDGSGVWRFSATHKYRDDNPTISSSDGYGISVAVWDDDTVGDSDAILLTVNNTPPEIDPESVEVNFPMGDEGLVGDPLLVSARFSDKGQFDIHAVVIEWGDGDTSDTRASLSTAEFIEFHGAGGGLGFFTARHVYNFAGTFSVRVTVFDDDGGSDQFVLEVVVADRTAAATAISDELLDLLATDLAR